VNSYGPTCNDANHVFRFQLEDDLKSPATECPAAQLVTVMVALISPNLEVRKEALDCFVESDSMLETFVTVEIILEIRRCESMPVQSSF